MKICILYFHKYTSLDNDLSFGKMIIDKSDSLIRKKKYTDRRGARYTQNKGWGLAQKKEKKRQKLYPLF